MSDFGTNTVRKSKKLWRCEWCGQAILINESHQHYVGKWQDEFQNWRMHLECWDDYSTNYDPDGFTPYSAERPKVVEYE